MDQNSYTVRRYELISKIKNCLPILVNLNVEEVKMQNVPKNIKSTENVLVYKKLPKIK